MYRNSKVNFSILKLRKQKYVSNDVVGISTNICSIYGEGIIIDQNVRNWFSKFDSEEFDSSVLIKF